MASKGLIILLCVVAAAVADEKYTDKYDNIDMEEIISNKRLMEGYMNCILEKGPCTPEGKELKVHLVDAITTGCKKCTKTQEEKSFLMMKHLINFELGYWNELCEKFDPEGKWRKTYEDRAKAHGIEIPA